MALFLSSLHTLPLFFSSWSPSDPNFSGSPKDRISSFVQQHPLELRTTLQHCTSPNLTVLIDITMSRVGLGTVLGAGGDKSNRVLRWRHGSLHWRVRVHRSCRSWGLADRHLHDFMPAIGDGAVPGLGVVQVLLRTVLHSDDAIEGLEAAPQLQVDFTLDVHKDEATREANGHHNQLSPEGPLQHTWKDTDTHTQQLLVPLADVWGVKMVACAELCLPCGV